MVTIRSQVAIGFRAGSDGPGGDGAAYVLVVMILPWHRPARRVHIAATAAFFQVGADAAGIEKTVRPRPAHG